MKHITTNLSFYFLRIILYSIPTIGILHITLSFLSMTKKYNPTGKISKRKVECRAHIHKGLLSKILSEVLEFRIYMSWFRYVLHKAGYSRFGVGFTESYPLPSYFHSAPRTSISKTRTELGRIPHAGNPLAP